MYHEYPYTTYFHDIDKLCKACHDAGYKLLVDANALKLLNKNDEVVSTVVIHYAETSLQDVDGKAIKSYIFNAAADTDELVFTKGDGTTFSLTIPYATKAEKDKLNKNLTSYVYEVQTSGNKIQIVKGDSTVTEITVPFATKALNDTNGKDIKTYAAPMTVDGDYIVLKDSTGAELARLTAPYALKAFSDDDGDTFTTTYAATLEAGTTTVILKAKDGNTLSTITVPYATKASTDPNGNAFLHDYAEMLVVDGDGKRIGLEAHDGTRLATITVPFATLATDATNAVETISVVGDQLVFTTYGGQAYSITAPYAVKAQKDDAGNTIKSTYVAAVTNDVQTGKLIFKDATGQTIVEITPTVSKATYDSYNNVIADYVKTILASASSDYVTVTHGDGDTEQITINYATHAWKDTNENVIKNTYIKRLACVEDVQDHHYKLVAYNGDTPEAELFRIELIAYEAQRAIGDKNGVDITTYVHDVTIDTSTKEVVVKDGTNTEKARFKAGGTQLKYNDHGTFTDIDEAKLGTGLEYNDTTGKINCTASGGVSYYEGTWSHYNNDWTNFFVYDKINITGGMSNIKNGDIVTVKGNDELKIGLASDNGNFKIYQHQKCYISTLYDTVLVCVGHDEFLKPEFCIVNNIPADDYYREYADDTITTEEKLGYLLNQMKYAYNINDNAETSNIEYILLNSSNEEVSADHHLYLVNDVKAMACYSFNSPNSDVTHIDNESVPEEYGAVPKGISTNTASTTGDFARYISPLAYKFKSSPTDYDKGYYPIYDNANCMKNLCNIIVVLDKIKTI